MGRRVHARGADAQGRGEGAPAAPPGLDPKGGDPLPGPTHSCAAGAAEERLRREAECRTDRLTGGRPRRRSRDAAPGQALEPPEHPGDGLSRVWLPGRESRLAAPGRAIQSPYVRHQAGPERG